MTLSIRAPAQLLGVESQTLLADGIAVIWADPTGWGGIFETEGPADALHAAVATAPLVARLRIVDGREVTVTLTKSAFVADELRPITFQGHGDLDTARFRAFTG